MLFIELQYKWDLNVKYSIFYTLFVGYSNLSTVREVHLSKVYSTRCQQFLGVIAEINQTIQ